MLPHTRSTHTFVFLQSLGQEKEEYGDHYCDSDFDSDSHSQTDLDSHRDSESHTELNSLCDSDFQKFRS